MYNLELMPQVDQQDTKGKISRNFFVDLKGDFVFVANREIC
jgi:hypothetical protein